MDLERCEEPDCRRDAEYRVVAPGVDVLVCRWHVDAAWRPHGADADVVALHRDVPEIDTAVRGRGALVPALVIVAFVAVVFGLFTLAPVLL